MSIIDILKKGETMKRKIALIEVLAVFLAITSVLLPFRVNQLGTYVLQIVLVILSINIVVFVVYYSIHLKVSKILADGRKYKNLYIKNLFKNPKEFLRSFLYRFEKIQQEMERQRNLVKEHERLNKKLEKQGKINELVISISNSIGKINNIEDFFMEILNHAIDVIDNGHKGSILTINEDGYFEYKASVGFNHEKLLQIKIPKEEVSLTRETNKIATEPAIINNLSEFNKNRMSEKQYKILEEAKGLDVKSTISCPIIINNRIYGLLNIDSQVEGGFTEEDILLMKYFTSQVQNAIKNYKLIEDKLYLSRHDSLTGLYNRHYFKEHLYDAFNDKQGECQIFSMVVFDLNNLKEINDSHGHDGGDDMIIAFANQLRGCFRKTDIMARYGGDEFIGIFWGMDGARARDRIESMITYLQDNPIQLDDHFHAVSVSYGISVYPHDSHKIEELFKLADKRMYKNKMDVKGDTICF